jgi:hypothetical protein
MQLYRYFLSQSTEVCRHNPFCCFSTSVCYYCCLFRYRVSPETLGYTLCVCVSFSFTFVTAIVCADLFKTLWLFRFHFLRQRSNSRPYSEKSLNCYFVQATTIPTSSEDCVTERYYNCVYFSTCETSTSPPPPIPPHHLGNLYLSVS